MPSEVVLAIYVSGGGAVLGEGIECRGSCTQHVAKGTRVTLTAAPDAGQVFEGWAGACLGAGACDLTVVGDTALSAAFGRAPAVKRQLTVRADGRGTVRSVPAGIDCGATCSASFDDGTTVVLMALEEAGNLFSGWGGACAGTNSCILTMGIDAQVSARFDRLPPQKVAISVTVSGSGSVTGSGLDCPASTCGASVNADTPVTLTARADANSRFTGWTGACAGQGAVCSLNVKAAASTTATFEVEVLTLAPADGTNNYVFGLNSTHVFFQRYGNNISGLWRVAKGGGEAKMITSWSWATYIVADDSYVYWTDSYSIVRAPVNGGPNEMLYPGEGYNVRTLVLDRGDLFWTSSYYDPGWVRTGPASGGAVTTLSTGRPTGGLAVDSQYVYWTSRDSVSGGIMRVPRAGGATDTLINCGTCQPWVVRVDANNLYYRNIDGDTWARGKTGGDFHKLSSGNAGNQGVYSVDLAVNGGIAWWTWSDYTPGNAHGLFRAPADGSSWTAVDTAADNSWGGPRLDDKYVYYFHAGALHRRLK